MFVIREYRHDDLADCMQCFYEGFFNCPVTENDRKFLMDYTQVLIEKSNFTLVAVADDSAVGFICGMYQKRFDRILAKQHMCRMHFGVWCRFVFRYFLGLYRLSPSFKDAFELFFYKVRQCYRMPLGECDCELSSLASRKAYRKGVGTALVDGFVDQCHWTHAKEIRLFTNTAANYGFYDKYGFSLVKEAPFRLEEIEGKSFVYAYKIPEYNRL